MDAFHVACPFTSSVGRRQALPTCLLCTPVSGLLDCFGHGLVSCLRLAACSSLKLLHVLTYRPNLAESS